MENTKSQSGEREGYIKKLLKELWSEKNWGNISYQLKDDGTLGVEKIGLTRKELKNILEMVSSESKKEGIEEGSRKTAELALKGIDILSKQYGTKKEAEEMVEVLKKLESLVG